MAFKRREAAVESVDLNTIFPDDAEKKIIAGVKKYATNEGTWSKADRNTPYLGSIIGMGIESANLADITMSIERQFLTKKTKRVPVEGSETEFTLEDGDLGKLRILEGQDAVMATPGLTLKKLMDLGHLPLQAAYLEGVVSFATVTAIGAGYRTNDAVRKTLSRMEKLSPEERGEAKTNLESLAKQAAEYEALLGDPAALTASRQKEYETDKAAFDSLKAELGTINEKLKGVTASDDPSRSASLKTEEGQVRTRIRMMKSKLLVSEESARGAGKRNPVDDAKFQEIRTALAETIKLAQAALAGSPVNC